MTSGDIPALDTDQEAAVGLERMLGVRRYRKTAFADAVQFTAVNGRDLARWCGGGYWPGNGYLRAQVSVPTLEREVSAYIGDWVCRGVDGEFWRVRGDIFGKTYAPCEEYGPDEADLG